MVNKSIFHPNYDEFRRTLTVARKSSGTTQFSLAKKLGKPQSFVSKYERGERRLDVHEFFQVAEALNIDAFKLLKSVYGAGRQKKAAL